MWGNETNILFINILQKTYSPCNILIIIQDILSFLIIVPNKIGILTYN